MSLLQYETKQQLGFVTLKNEKEHNALSLQLIHELKEQLQRIGEEKEVKVVILQGSSKVFSAGHNLKEIEAKSVHEVQSLFQDCIQLMKTIREIPQLVIAKVQGAAAAAGCQLVAVSDMAVAGEEATFSTPGINSGLFCSTPAVFLSRNVGRKQACEMLFTGRFITAREALEHQLVNRVVPSEELDEVTEKLAGEVAKQSLAVIELGKKMFYEQLNMHDWEALNYATEVISLNTKHPDAVEGIRAFLEKRKPEWRE